MDSDHVSILLDIKSEVGALNARMTEASRSRERMEKRLDEVKDDIGEIKPVVAVVKEMKPEHEELMEFKKRIGFYVGVAGSIAMGAVALLWHGLGYISDIIKVKLFH